MRNTRLDAAIQRWYEAGVVSGQLVVSHDYVALCEAAFASQGPQSFNEFTTGTDPLPAPVKHVTLVRF